MALLATTLVSVSLDDADDSQHKALAKAQEYGIVGTLFVPAGKVNPPEMSPDDADFNDWYMNWDGVRDFVVAGWEIGSHTLTHPDLLEELVKQPGEVEKEIIGPIDIIKRETGTAPISFAPPYGNFEDPDLDPEGQLLKIIKAHYTYNFRAWDDDGLGHDGENKLSGGNPYNISRLDVGTGSNASVKQACKKIGEAQARGEWLILTVHEIVDGAPKKYQISKKQWETLLGCIAKARDEGKIEVLTLKDAAARVFER